MPKKVNKAYTLLLKALIISILMISAVFFMIDRKIENRHWMYFLNLALSDNKEPRIKNTLTAVMANPLPPGEINVDGNQVSGLANAFKAAKKGSVIQIGKGHYNEAASLYASDVKIFADEGTVIHGQATQGKAALVIGGNNIYIEGIECHSISVDDQNGACIRLEGAGLILNNVYFHDSQSGLLGSFKGGNITIENSRFENIGFNGRAHEVYTMGKVNRLTIKNSIFLNAQSGGHEIKSRAAHTEITNSIIATTYGRDSRLVDAPNGGNLILHNNVFIEGPNSENADLFSWGVEGVTNPGRISIEDNIIISDKPVANLIAISGFPDSTTIQNNIVVGRIFGMDDEINIVFPDRESAGIPPAPFIPRLDQLASEGTHKNLSE